MTVSASAADRTDGSGRPPSDRLPPARTALDVRTWKEIAHLLLNLPVKGSYGAIWQFALGALRAIPFASLDDIGFRRDSIGDPVVEARLRLTLYLKDVPGGER